MFKSRLLSSTAFVQAQNSAAQKLTWSNNISIQADVTVDSPSAAVLASATDIANATDTFTKTAHGFLTGLVVRATTSGVLPTGLAVATDYFVIVVTANTFKLASSLVNANAGTAINITDDGTGNQTLTPSALASGVVKVQASNDGTSWADVTGATLNVTATGPYIINVTDAGYKWARVAFTLASGALTASVVAVGKEHPVTS